MYDYFSFLYAILAFSVLLADNSNLSCKYKIESYFLKINLNVYKYIGI